MGMELPLRIKDNCSTVAARLDARKEVGEKSPLKEGLSRRDGPEDEEVPLGDGGGDLCTEEDLAIGGLGFLRRDELSPGLGDWHPRRVEPEVEVGQQTPDVERALTEDVNELENG